jgi:hypothetical protein
MSMEIPKDGHSQKPEGNLQHKIVIYLAGKIPKGSQLSNDALWWTRNHMKKLQTSLKEFDIELLNPAFKDCDLTDQDLVFARDMHYVSKSHIIFVDARDRRGLGVGVEMMWAKMHGIPIIVWAPKDTHYNRGITLGAHTPDFIHPFVAGLSDKIVESLDEGAVWIKKWIKDPHSAKIKNSESIHSIVEDFRKLNTK